MTQAKRRRVSPEIRKAQILEAAVQTFRANGLQGSTVDQIASAAGVSVGLLYRFFASKTAIIEAIVEQDIEIQLGRTAALLREASQHPDALPEQLIEHLSNEKIDRENFALQFEIAAEVCRNPQLGAFMRARRTQLIAALAKDVPAGNGAPLTERTLEKLDLAGAVASGLAMHAAIYSDGQRLPHEIIAALIQTIFARDTEH